MTKTELNPCPFCGGKAKLTDSYERGDTCRSWIAVIEHGCTENTSKFKGARVIYKARGRDAAEAINNVIEAWNRRANDIARFPTIETEPKWIAVEERLPEEWEPVLAMIYIDELSDRPIIDTMWFIGNINGRNKWRVCWNGDMVESDVTHWMPLPDYHPDYNTKMDGKEAEE